MASKKTLIRFLFGGGWATDFGPEMSVAPSQGGDIIVPFLVDAENVVFELDGGPHKVGGTTKWNSAAIASGAEIMGMKDFWMIGTGGSPTHKIVAHAGTVIVADAADGTFANIATGKTDNAIPSYTTFRNVLIIASTSATDNPQSYDGTTCADLAGSPPRFRFSCAHKNRLWAAGNVALASRLYYSGLLDQTDWSGSTSGSIDIDPDDGDWITGLVSHKNELWVFKGPYKGSIHRIVGSAPTGSDAFARQTFIEGIGAVWHNTIFRFRDDVGFMWSDGTLHSLNATAAFGDFNETALSRPIHNYIHDRATFSSLNRCWAETLSCRSLVLITMPVDSSTFCNQILVMDYSRGNDIRWSQWPAFDANCVAAVIDTTASNRPRLFIGGTDGFIRRTQVANRSIDTTGAYTAKVTVPYTDLGAGFLMKTLAGAAVGLAPKGPYNMNFAWQCDTNTQQTATVAQSGGTPLGTFVLSTDVLGGSAYADKFIEETSGEFRSIQFQATQTAANQDMELHNIKIAVEVGSLSMEN